jgi:hypothetical protein
MAIEIPSARCFAAGHGSPLVMAVAELSARGLMVPIRRRGSTGNQQ